MVLLDGKGNQYDTAYGGTLDSFGQVFPGVSKSGYVLFEDIPQTTATLNLVFELGYDAGFNPFIFSYNIALVQ